MGAQDAADPADRDAHLVHRVVVVVGEAYERIIGEQHLGLPSQVGGHDLPGGTGRIRPFDVGDLIGEHHIQLRRGPALASP